MPLGVISAVGFLMLGSVMLMTLRVDRAREDFYKARQQLDLYRAEVWQLEYMNEPAANQELKEEQAKFLSGKNVAFFIETITAAGKQFEISFVSISPKDKLEMKPEEKTLFPNLARIPVEMVIKGAYQNISLFLSQLSKLDNSVIRVEEFRFTQPNANEAVLNGFVLVSVLVPQDAAKPIASPDFNLAIEQRSAGKSRFREFGRNPFNVWTEPAALEALVLEGIMYDASQPVVLINGKIWRQGDQIGDVQILEIKPTSIVVERNGKQETVRLKTG